MTRTITVRGRGFVSAQPTEVFVSLESAAVRPTAAEAFGEATRRHAALDALCEQLGIDERRRTTTHTSVHEYREQMEDAVSWRASYSTAVHLEEAELAGRLLREAVEKVEARIAGGPGGAWAPTILRGWKPAGARLPTRSVARRPSRKRSGSGAATSSEPWRSARAISVGRGRGR